MNPFDDNERRGRDAIKQADHDRLQVEADHVAEIGRFNKRTEAAIAEAIKEREAAMEQATADADRELDERIRRICREEIAATLMACGMNLPPHLRRKQ